MHYTTPNWLAEVSRAEQQERVCYPDFWPAEFKTGVV